jgi:hypothetical protein
MKVTITKNSFAFLVLFVITVHAFFMNGFYHVHPQNNIGTYYASTFSKIDPSLFKNSIFVQGIDRNNLRMSLFFDVAPLLLKNFDFEMFVMIQGFLSTFLVMAGIFALTKIFFNNTTAGFIAALLYTAQLNEWVLGSPGTYLNYFHPGLTYSYPLIVWSLVFFFQNKFHPAILLCGISWNFHPMCTAFLLFIYFVYFVCNFKQFRILTVLSLLTLLVLAAGPSLIKTIGQTVPGQASGPLWLKGVYWNMWFTCFPSSWPWTWFARAGFFFVLFVLCMSQIQNSLLKQKIRIVLYAVGFMCFIGTIFVDIFPVPLIIKISFWRSTVLYVIIALPCIAYVLQNMLQRDITRQFISVIFIIFLTGYFKYLPTYYFPFLLLVLGYALYEKKITSKVVFLRGRFPLFFLITLLIPVCFQSSIFSSSAQVAVLFLIMYAFIWVALRLKKFKPQFFRPILLGGIFMIVFDLVVIYDKGGPDIYYHGKIQGKVDPWSEIQIQAKQLSHKDDLFIVPPYLNDFCSYSNRAILGDWAEGANMLYLDNQFTEEWFERMTDLGWTERFNGKQGYNRLTTDDMVRVAQKYRAKFVVTEKPKTFKLFKAYENDLYMLYAIP